MVPFFPRNVIRLWELSLHSEAPLMQWAWRFLQGPDAFETS